MSCPVVIEVITPGPPGPAGPTGPTGVSSAWLQGAGAPGGEIGADGDFYLNTETGDIYGPLTDGDWGPVVFNIAEGQAGPQGPAGEAGPAGPAGVNGRTVLNGSGAPGSGVGANGDFYVDTASWVIYGPKTAGAWPGGASLIGPTGPIGPAGQRGPKGDPGDPAPGTDLNYDASTRLLSSSTGQDVTLPLAGDDPGLLGGASFSGPSGWTASGSVSGGNVTLSLSLPAGFGLLSSADQSKLTGIASGATANATDAQLRDRSTHTGTQAASTITGLAAVATGGAYGDLSGRPTLGTAAAANTGTSAGNVPVLDSSGLVPSVLLPGFVDDVLEFASVAAFPATGEAGKLYISLATNRQYRWSGSIYVEINPSPGSSDAVPEGSVNFYFTTGRGESAAASWWAGVSTAAGRALVTAADAAAQRAALGLGTAAATDASAYATAAQGAKADTAVQPATLSGYVQTSDVRLTTDLTYDAATREVRSSTGADVALPLVTSAAAGLLPAPPSGAPSGRVFTDSLQWVQPTNGGGGMNGIAASLTF